MNEAKKFDSGKLELYHIHPCAWRYVIAELYDLELAKWDLCMNRWFYDKDPNGVREAMADLKPVHLEGLMKVLQFGGQKYGALNYTKGMKYSRILSAFRRHELAVANGEEIDSDSGLPHKYHSLANLMFAVAYNDAQLGEDDRAN